MADYRDAYWRSADEVRLHYRDYAGGEDRPPILCLPGLTRNARDCEGVADRLAGDWRVLALDFRGRGESGYARDPMTYVPLTYVQDVSRLIDELALERCVLFGTSLGGIVAMLLAAHLPEKVAGVLLNDVGPVIEPGGLERIRSYVGRSASYPTWLHAARALAAANADVHPGFGIEGWLAMARRLHRLTPQGRVTLDYDLKIAEPFRVPGGEAGVDLWPLIDGLKDVPALLLRGARSDVFGEATLAEMARRLPLAEAVTVPDVGHAPTLDEPEAIAAIERLLGRLDHP